MRLNRLELVRYGRFQDTALDFGAPPAGPDVTVVYGANEAGKSTAFTAWLDFLFGFRGGSQYAFRFDRKDMLVGAVLETPDGVQALRRSPGSRRRWPRSRPRSRASTARAGARRWRTRGGTGSARWRRRCGRRGSTRAASTG